MLNPVANLSPSDNPDPEELIGQAPVVVVVAVVVALWVVVT